MGSKLETYREKRIGETNINYQGFRMEIIDYINQKDISVKFEDGYIKEHIWYSSFKKGVIRNRNIPEIYDVGILGNIKTKDSNNYFTKEYSTWSNILQRCYSENKKKEFPTYRNVTICKEWLYYPNFVEWCHKQENWQKVIENKNNYHIDKDILKKHNNIYSPEYCIFVPAKINTLFVNSKSSRGIYPIGVSKTNSLNKKYRARINNPYGKQIEKSFFTVKEAFDFYKRVKEQIIQRMAQEELEKGTITQKCYEAMMNYQIEITD